MSTPLDREPAPDEPSPYAPRWARARSTALRLPDVADDGLYSEDPLPLGMQAASPGEAASQQRGVPVSLDPTVLPEPEPHRRSMFGMAAIALLAISAAAMVALLVVKMLPFGGAPVAKREPAAEPSSFASRYSDPTSQVTSQPVQALPQLVVAAAPVGQSDGPIPLGLALSAPRDGASVTIIGLAAGATLSRGRSAGAGSWRLAATELDRAAIQPPPGFAGTMEVLAELRLGDGTVIERRSLRFERAPPPAARRVVRQIDPEEIAALLKRGEDYIATGDLASARLVLQRAAEGGDARAALALAGTYDPNVLEQLGVKGFAPDVGLALAWYEKARDFGSAEAPRRLERLASRDR